MSPIGPAITRVLSCILTATVALVSLKPSHALSRVELQNRTGINGMLIEGLANERLGESVSGAGDINNDGFEDVLIGVPYATVDGKLNAGKVYVVYGSDQPRPANFDPVAMTVDQGFTIVGDVADTYLGLKVARGGDINGDGIDDILVSAPWSAAAGVFSGSVFVIFGKETFSESIFEVASLNGTNGVRFNAAMSNDLVGNGLAGVGDVNDDGFGDFLAGGPQVEVGGVGTPGAAYLVFGRTTFSSATYSLDALGVGGGMQINGAADGDMFGSSASPAGDFNDDGIADFLVSAPQADSNGTNAGTSYLVFGRETAPATFDISTLDENTGMVITGPSAGSNFGHGLALAPDIDGNGFDDLVIGAPYFNGIAGAAFVVLGDGTTTDTLSAATLDGARGFSLTGEEFGASAGYSVTGIGDIDGDGLGDLAIGGPNAAESGSNAGAVYVVLGQPEFSATHPLTDSSGVRVIKMLGSTSRAGTSVSAIGNFNGGSRYGFIAGGPVANLNTGAAYIVHGFPELIAPKLKVSLNFAKPDKDGISLKASLPVGNGFAPASQEVGLVVGGAEYGVSLDEKGGYKTELWSIKVKSKVPKKPEDPQVAKLTFKQKKSDLTTVFEDEGLINADLSGEPVEIKTLLVIDDTVYTNVVNQLYTAKQGKSGKTK